MVRSCSSSGRGTSSFVPGAVCGRCGRRRLWPASTSPPSAAGRPATPSFGKRSGKPPPRAGCGTIRPQHGPRSVGMAPAPGVGRGSWSGRRREAGAFGAAAAGRTARGPVGDRVTRATARAAAVRVSGRTAAKVWSASRADCEQNAPNSAPGNQRKSTKNQQSRGGSARFAPKSGAGNQQTAVTAPEESKMTPSSQSAQGQAG
jgi:hypothetical protein